MHLIGKFPKVDSFVGCHYLRLLLFEEFFKIEVSIDRIITLDEFFVLVFGGNSELFIFTNCEEFTHF